MSIDLFGKNRDPGPEYGAENDEREPVLSDVLHRLDLSEVSSSAVRQRCHGANSSQFSSLFIRRTDCGDAALMVCG